MSQYSGYSSALSEGDAFNARTRNHNDLILSQNQIALDHYGKTLEDQKGKVRTDEINEDISGTLFGGKAGEGLLNSGIGTVEAVQGIGSKGLTGYLQASKESRLNTIGTTVKRLVSGDPLPAPTPAVESQGESLIGQWAGKPAVAEQVASDASKIAETGGKIETSSGAATIIKKGLSAAGLGEKVGEAGLTTVSEIGAKALGDFGGVTDLVKGFDNLGKGKSFYGNDDTAQKFGDTFQMAGATLDLMGTAFPPLEVLGGISSLIGGAIDGIDDLVKDSDRKSDDSKTLKPPVPKSTIVTPTYSALGLVASAPISVKAQIVGSGSF